MAIVGILALVLGVVFGCRSGVLLSPANPATRMPWWVNPPNRPWHAIAYRAVGAGLTVLGAVSFSQSIGYWSVLFVLVAFAIPSAIYIFDTTGDLQSKGEPAGLRLVAPPPTHCAVTLRPHPKAVR